MLVVLVVVVVVVCLFFFFLFFFFFFVVFVVRAMRENDAASKQELDKATSTCDILNAEKESLQRRLAGLEESKQVTFFCDVVLCFLTRTLFSHLFMRICLRPPNSPYCCYRFC